MISGQPISPDQIAEAKTAVVPPIVIDTFNRMIAASFTNGCATVYQDDVVNALTDAGLDRSDIYGKGWLNIEEVFRSAGWKVVYDRPAYNESYRASFEFSKK